MHGDVCPPVASTSHLNLTSYLRTLHHSAGVASVKMGENDASDRDPLPRPFGTYTLLRRIGMGGMGTVYEALQAQPKRRVALKLIRPDQVSEELLRRFAIEVQALGRLRHLGIASIYEGGNIDTAIGQQPYFVMELVEGLPLDEYVYKYRVGIRECVTLMTRVADALHHAHQQDVIHRDLKPANILVDESGQPKILDFGVARLIGSERPLNATAISRTEVGILLGTLPYMSPEQTEGDPDHFDQRSDVYSLGVIAYKLLAGRLPYQFSSGFIEAINIIHENTPERLGDIDERLRGDLETVVAKALAKERDQRYQTAQGFADDLRRVLSGRPVSVVPATLDAKVRRWTMRQENIRQAGWVGVIGCGLVAAFNFVWAIIGAVAWFWWMPVLPRDIRYTEFMLNTTGWTVALAVLAWVSWRAMKGHVLAMWVALISGFLLSGFTASVLFRFSSYDGGGILRDPVLRVSNYMLFAPLAFLGALTMLLALITALRLGQWDRPVIEPARPDQLRRLLRARDTTASL